jgi:sn-glycerol 3-phosphate transport system permease protein
MSKLLAPATREPETKAVTSAPTWRNRFRLPEPVVAWLMLLPGLIVLLLFTHYPVIRAVYHSFTDAGGEVTLENYHLLADDDVFWQVVRNNLVFALGTVPPSIAIALLMAVWVNRKLRGRGFLRLAYFTPAILPMVAVASIWLFFYTPGYGPVTTIFEALGLPVRNWLGDPDTVMPALIVMTIWKEAGFFMIFYLAGLQNMSVELEEASILEGASRWYHFRRVTFPLLMPTTLFVLVVALTNSFKQVDHLFIMTDGGPNNASSLLLYYIYQVAFQFYDLPYAAVLTVALVVILVGMALAQFRLFEKRIHYR